jgi:hypothetical protein
MNGEKPYFHIEWIMDNVFKLTPEEKAENQKYWAKDPSTLGAAPGAEGAPAEGAPTEGEAPAEGGEAPAQGGAQAAPEEPPAEGGGEAPAEGGGEFEF